MKKFASILMVSVMAFSTWTAQAATLTNLNDPTIGVMVSDNREILTDTPNLMAQTFTAGADRMYLCKTLDDSICTNGHNIRSIAFLPPCSPEIDINCIASVYAIDEAGNKTLGKFNRYVAEDGGNQYAANPKYNLPQGKGQGSIWTMPGLKNGAGNEEYYVGALFESWATFGGGRIFENFYPSKMVTAITPVSTKLGAYGFNYALDSNQKSNDGSINGGVGYRNDSQEQNWNDCVVTETGKCYMAADFPTSYRFGITLKIGATLKGWFHGRIYKPVISTKTASAGGAEELTIEALPVAVPTLKEKMPTASISDELRNFLSNNQVGNGFGYIMPESSGEAAFNQTKMWIPLVKDKATTSNSYWSVRTLEQINDPIIANCTKSDGALSGVVTTNALVYHSGPPSFDKSTQNLEYKVLSTHYSADGGVAKGTYDLIMSSSVARCIYGFTNAPISASLTILSEDGSPQVATQVINEKNGWLTLSAAGFTYSSPTIAVKLTQDKAAVATPTPKTPSWAQSTKTITCVKGKTTKKVSGFNPKCPTGYKKKA
ncbi:hypothetical protein MCEMRE196_01193 [Candidatus Nanopelagicaceae bacterium]